MKLMVSLNIQSKDSYLTTNQGFAWFVDEIGCKVASFGESKS
jgi:hypothetical protein